MTCCDCGCLTIGVGWLIEEICIPILMQDIGCFRSFMFSNARSIHVRAAYVYQPGENVAM